ncbi:MAG: hypothetical protein ABJD24_14935 [Acidimicrobiales bacterium]
MTERTSMQANELAALWNRATRHYGNRLGQYGLHKRIDHVVTDQLGTRPWKLAADDPRTVQLGVIEAQALVRLAA